MYTASTLHLLTCVFIETTAQWAVSPKWTPKNYYEKYFSYRIKTVKAGQNKCWTCLA